ncbi:hypothetical protein H0H93_013946 [Arthromyces matolae]|nr:hypothetical protein H0H93_013946 [Arthromyces matolae]
MSPDRQRVASPTRTQSKPYARPMTPESSPDSIDFAQNEALSPSKSGFPTYERYKEIEASYLKTLPASRRDKAIISQAMFDRIWAVLHSHDASLENPQFRFWVRKKFVLGKLAKPLDIKVDESEGSDTPESGSGEPPQTVILHEKNVVAVQEQLYDILCYGHAVTDHGGRDRTCSSIRQHYTWIPKELVAQFIKACPTCIARKCGIKKKDSNATKSLREYLRSLESKPLFTSSPKSPKRMPLTPANSSTQLDRLGNNSAPPQLPTLESAPMSREVSLYQGLPNGWQFQHDDITDAQNAFISELNKKPPHIPKAGGRSNRRPRVPSIAPVMRSHSEPPPALGSVEVHSPLLQPITGTEDVNAESDSISSSVRPPLLEPIPGSPWLADSRSFVTSTPRPPNRGTTDSGPPKSSASLAVPTTPPSTVDLDSETLSSEITVQSLLALRHGRNVPVANTASARDTRNVDQPTMPPSSSDSSSLYALAVIATQSMPLSSESSKNPLVRITLTDDADANDISGMDTQNTSTEAVCNHGNSVVVRPL